ncbi:MULTISPECIES: cytochrome d ubiquinol oxidase subunit II [Thalassobaculum]|uniref:Cytochrome bd-I ubiquinol oxidase subunit 2 apoprotein n=1 Tax=Thalassobaculum litoreum DSM 18839 TaxID=1123362 RepID=A0A8G2BLZ7_9PROT|nr:MULTISPECIES: cytochrome d ubiquinol oxidase subunit II [Thalassobaculum]SDG03622.1 cytochrome bd-I ubiquinol oxidase subunit 2 apoprotein [Thalassobaculum litoreum DSM 18839]
MEMDLALIWALLIATAVLLYVVLDGFDLGIGLVFPFLSDEGERDVAMNTVAPVWDGNETWLVLGGGGLFAVFPLAYAVLMPAVYAPVTAMLLGLVFRGVAFEFRWKTVRWKRVWDWSFTLGSLVAALSQGIILGALVQGIEVENRAYAGGWWDWLTPFSLLCGVAVAIGYALLGATWLVMKTEDGVRDHGFRIAWPAAIGTVVMVGAVSLWTPFLDPVYMERWFSLPWLLWAAPVPVLTGLTVLSLGWGLLRRRDYQPFISAQILFVLCFVGLGISFYPNIVPPSVSIWDAAAPDESLGFLLVGTAVLLPIILAYTIYAYSVFRGKVRAGEGYH